MAKRGRSRLASIAEATFTFILVIVAMGAINASAENSGETRFYNGSASDSITTPMFDVRIHDVHVTDEVVFEGVTTEAAGLFVVIEWSADAKQSRQTFSRIEFVTADQTTFYPRSHIALMANPATVDPGFTTTGTTIFDVQESRVEAADFNVLSTRGVLYTYGGGARFRNIADDATYVPSLQLTRSTVSVTP